MTVCYLCWKVFENELLKNGFNVSGISNREHYFSNIVSNFKYIFPNAGFKFLLTEHFLYSDIVHLISETKN